MMGRNRSSAALRTASAADRCSSRSAVMAKSTIMMPFFLTMPIRRITPIMATRLKSKPNNISVAIAPAPADGKVDRIVSGWM